jgi:hypothetical protein
MGSPVKSAAKEVNDSENAVPTRQKPQLDHVPFSAEQADRFHRELIEKRALILEISGFNEEFTAAGFVNPNIEQEADAFLLELAGILVQAATIRLDAGYKAKNKLVATLRAIKLDPSLVLKEGIEPEALAVLAANYQRGDEKPGTFWFDIDPADQMQPPDVQRVIHAASAAIGKLSAMTQTGRPRDAMLHFLGERLSGCFLRFNITASRHSIAADSENAQAEAGPFLNFLTVVLAPLNLFLSPGHIDAKPVSPAQVARIGLEERAGELALRASKS